MTQSTHNLVDTMLNDFDIAAIRRDFPILNQQINGHP
jgi:cysteine desulfurase/selenocysteine lyase